MIDICIIYARTILCSSKIEMLILCSKKGYIKINYDVSSPVSNVSL